MVYGGLACLLHGHERMTRDADLFLEDTDENLRCALASLTGWGEATPANSRQPTSVKTLLSVFATAASSIWQSKSGTSMV